MRIIWVLFIFSPSFLYASNIFAKTYGGSDWDHAYCIEHTINRGYVLTGSTHSFGGGGYDVLVARLSGSGYLYWAKTFGGNYDDYGYSIQQRPDGGYILAGYTFSYPGMSNILVIKLDIQGKVVWAKIYKGNSYDYAYSIQPTPDGGYILGGYTYSYGAGNADILVLKINSYGGFRWAKTFGGSNEDYAYCIQETLDGGYILAGYTYSFGAGIYDILVLKLDSQGNLEWAKTFGGANYEYVRSIQQTSDGGYILAGYTSSFGAGGWDILILKLNVEGNLVWAKTFGGATHEYPYSIQETPDGGYILAGRTYSFGAGGYDFLVLKLDSTGSYPDCQYLQNCTPSLTSPDVSVTPISPVILSISIPFYGIEPETSSVLLSISDICPPIDIHESLPSSKKFSQYPVLSFEAYYSPFSNSIIIKYILEKQSRVTLDLYNLSGNLIKNIYKGLQEKGYYKFEIETKEEIKRGIYFIKLKTGELIFNRKVTILK